MCVYCDWLSPYFTFTFFCYNFPFSLWLVETTYLICAYFTLSYLSKCYEKTYLNHTVNFRTFEHYIHWIINHFLIYCKLIFWSIFFLIYITIFCKNWLAKSILSLILSLKLSFSICILIYSQTHPMIIKLLLNSLF